MQLVSFLTTLVALTASVAAGTSAASPLVVNTPASAVQCTPTNITWSGGGSLFFLEIYSANGSVFQDTNINQHFFVWNTNVVEGDFATVEIIDDLGDEAFSAVFIVQPSSDFSCL